MMATNYELCEYVSTSSDSSDDGWLFDSEGAPVYLGRLHDEDSDSEEAVVDDLEQEHWTGLHPEVRRIHQWKIGPKHGPTRGSLSNGLCDQFTHLEVSVKVSCCKSFENFKSKLKKTVATYHFLDPACSRQFVKGKFDLDSSGMVMLQGALINIVAHWEEFIVEIIKEGFSLFIEVGSGNPPSLETLRRSLPCSDLILKKELRQVCQTQSVEEKLFNLLEGWGSRQYCAIPWAEYYASYCQNTISGAQLVPIFSPGAPNSIDTLFTKLFTGGCSSLSEQLLKIGRFRYKIRLNHEDEVELQINSINGLKNISRLYYALRCVFAHGHNQKTVSGVLKDFPQSVAEFDLGNDRVAKYYLGLYRRLEKYGRDTSISYLTFVNMIEFLKRAAFFLMRALAKWVYEATGGQTCIWNYKPHT